MTLLLVPRLFQARTQKRDERSVQTRKSQNYAVRSFATRRSSVGIRCTGIYRMHAHTLLASNRCSSLIQPHLHQQLRAFLSRNVQVRFLFAFIRTASRSPACLCASRRPSMVFKSFKLLREERSVSIFAVFACVLGGKTNTLKPTERGGRGRGGHSHTDKTDTHSHLPPHNLHVAQEYGVILIVGTIVYATSL